MKARASRFGWVCGVLIVALLIPAGRAAADTIVAGVFDLSGPASGFTTDVAPAAFDPSLGTLTAVTVEYSNGPLGSYTVNYENLQPFPVYYAVGQSYENTFTVPGFTFEPGSPGYSSLGTLGAFDGGDDSSDSATVRYIDNITGVEDTTYGGPDWAPFLGTGTLAATVYTDYVFEFLSGPAGYSPAYTVQPALELNVTLTVRYQYDPAVPEPSSLALLATGLPAVVACARRRRKPTRLPTTPSVLRSGRHARVTRRR